LVMKKIYLILILFLAVSITNCSNPQSPPITATTSIAGGDIPGTAIQTNSVSEDEDQTSSMGQIAPISPTETPTNNNPDDNPGNLIQTSPPQNQTQPTPENKPTRELTSNAWKGLPVIPQVSKNVKSIYQRGLALNNNPNAYSKIGDCGSTPAWFLGDFDRGPEYYELGEFTQLMEVIQEFQGSHERTSLGARAGFNAPSLFVSLWSDIEHCQPDEGPLECEYRVHQPIAAFIMLGANDIWHPDKFEPSMRKIIEYSINNGVIPILSTKADNQEKDGSINLTIARLAQEYDIPMINFWRAVQDLPDKGLQEDGVHLTWGKNDFSDPKYLKTAWTIRNLTALQTLDAVWRTATGQSPQ